MTETMASHQESHRQSQDRLRELLIKLPGVEVGTRFGGEAFFFRNRFFCHFHPTRDAVFLETFVWNKVEDVVGKIRGTVPHPEYGGYGWVRLPLDTEDALSRGRQLIEVTYRYLRTIRRVSVPKLGLQARRLELLRTTLPEVTFRVTEAKKRYQILLEATGIPDYEQAGKLLDEANRILKGSRNPRGGEEQSRAGR